MKALSLAAAISVALEAQSQGGPPLTYQQKANDDRNVLIASSTLFAFLLPGALKAEDANYVATLAVIGGTMIGFTIALDTHKRKARQQPKPL